MAVPLSVLVRDGAMVMDLLRCTTLISSGPHRGGLTSSRYVVNYTVSTDFCPVDVPASIVAKLTALGLPPEQCTACLTAVKVENCTSAQACDGSVCCTVWVTAGIGNLSSPGLTAVFAPAPGTINIIALVQADVPPSALVEAVQIITEVKARTLAGRLTQDGHPATGTSTDTVTVVQLPGPPSPYCGAVTPVGFCLAQATQKALLSALMACDAAKVSADLARPATAKKLLADPEKKRGQRPEQFAGPLC